MYCSVEKKNHYVGIKFRRCYPKLMQWLTMSSHFHFLFCQLYIKSKYLQSRIFPTFSGITWFRLQLGIQNRFQKLRIQSKMQKHITSTPSFFFFFFFLYTVRVTMTWDFLGKMETAFEISRRKKRMENWYFLGLKKWQIFQSHSSLEKAALSLI